MKWAWWILLLTVIASIFGINPRIIKAVRGDSRKQFLQKPLMPSAHFFNTASINDTASKVFLYRSDLQRTGIVYTRDIHPMARPLWRIPDFNIENHGASKSSPVSDGDATYLGSDRGNFARVSSAGNVDWRISTSATKGIHGSAAI